MQLKLFDSKRRCKQTVQFPPDQPLGIYVCGPTVYDDAHIGHARSYIVFDVIVRLLRHLGPVCYVRNYTDIDDKIIEKAKQTGQPWQAVADRYIASFQADMALLGVAEPDVTPRVTQHIPQIIALVELLLARGAAYCAQGDVYFSVEHAKAYGQLAHRTLADMQAGARVEISAAKRHPMDFVLWKGAKPGEPSWPAPFGPGRPGWHIECSAMAKAYLGETFAIHGGGQDLLFPHHENEIAQSEAAHDCTYAQIWLHNGLLISGQQKMSKSLGNGLSIQALGQQVVPEAIRLFFLSHHYRSNIQFDVPLLQQAEQRLLYMYQSLQRAQQVLAQHPVSSIALDETFLAHMREHRQGMWDGLADDVNTAKTLGHLSDIFRILNDTLATSPIQPRQLTILTTLCGWIAEVGGILGLLQVEPQSMLAHWQQRAQAKRSPEMLAQVEALVLARQQARANRDYGASDRLRDELQALGVAVQDSKDGMRWSFVED